MTLLYQVSDADEDRDLFDQNDPGSLMASSSSILSPRRSSISFLGAGGGSRGPSLDTPESSVGPHDHNWMDKDEDHSHGSSLWTLKENLRLEVSALWCVVGR